jgi:hypothetical protein
LVIAPELNPALNHFATCGIISTYRYQRHEMAHFFEAFWSNTEFVAIE